MMYNLLILFIFTHTHTTHIHTQRKLMEIKRASFVTPPVTPRGSVLFGMNNLGTASSGPHFDHADITDFLKTLQGNEDTLSIPEVDEHDMKGEDEVSKIMLSNNFNVTYSKFLI